MAIQLKSTNGLHGSRIKALVYGNAGAGKTKLLGTWDNQKTLLISAESGLLSLEDQNISVLECKSYADVREAYQFVTQSDEAQQFELIGIDSLTEIADMIVGHLEQQPEYQDPKNTMKLWSEYNKRITAIVKGFRALEKHVIFTALPEDVKDGDMLVTKPFIKGNAAQRMLESYFDEVFHLYVERADGSRRIQTQPTTTHSAKDRSGKLADPEEADLSTIFQKIQSKQQENAA